MFLGILSERATMKLELKRRHGTSKYTLGTLYIDGHYFCETLEDQEREEKIPHETAIPLGTYKVVINMSIRFKRLMPLLLNVPNFEGIRIHAGNTDKDTDGCILVGRESKVNFIKDSRVTYTELMAKLNMAVQNKEQIEITIS